MVTKGGTVKLPVGMLVKGNIIGSWGSFLLFCSNTPLHGQIVFSLDFSHHMTMWQLTSLENAKMHPKAKASSFPLNHIAQILF